MLTLLDDDHCDRKFHVSRPNPKNPHASRLAYQSTAPLTGAGIRSTPNGLTQIASPSIRFTSLSRHPPFGPHLRATPKRSKSWRSGQCMARKAPISPIPARRLTCLTNLLAQRYSSDERKSTLKIPLRSVACTSASRVGAREALRLGCIWRERLVVTARVLLRNRRAPWTTRADGGLPHNHHRPRLAGYE